MITLDVRHPAGSYPLCLGDGVLDQLGAFLGKRGVDHVAVVTNDVVRGLHGARLSSLLDAAGVEATWLEVPDGERHKTLATVNGLYGPLLTTPWERSRPVLAFGGGVVGDMAGFLAATLLRGVPFIQIPTTLLSMVDSSIGGKVGVDVPEGKNLVGAFKQPEAVFIDPTLLETLPVEEWRAGMAEVVKHGVLGGGSLVELLETEPLDRVAMLHRAIGIKKDVVEEDPFEHGRRATLNLGHTFGHAFERLLDYSIRHGEAVAMGLACATRLARHRGLCAAADADRILALLTRHDLPVLPPPLTPAAVFEAMASDKKRSKGRVRVILPLGIGRVAVFPEITPADVATALIAPST